MDKFTYQLVENTADVEAAHEVKRAVFVEEQGIDESIVFEDLDTLALHLVVKLNDQVIGTARVRCLHENQAKIERMAVFKPGVAGVSAKASWHFSPTSSSGARFAMWYYTLSMTQ